MYSVVVFCQMKFVFIVLAPHWPFSIIILHFRLKEIQGQGSQKGLDSYVSRIMMPSCVAWQLDTG